MKEGFRWCPHCGKPHTLAERLCTATGLYIDVRLHQSPRDSFLTPGTVIDGKYRIMDAIGVGGMAIVFDAISLPLGRRVAIKVVGAQTRPDATQRLMREASILTKLQHPNICDVYDVGKLANGSPYIVLERLYGGTLGSRIARQGRMDVQEAIDVFVQVLSGLHVAHSHRVLHRDLKPHNIFLSARIGCAPLASLVDFGLALDLEGTRITRPGRACGTPQYMSPDQLRDEPLDARSDLFCAGVSLYETITGKHPFLGRNYVETCERIAYGEPLPLRQHGVDAPPALEAALRWALAKSRSQRPASALALQEALRAVYAPNVAAISDRGDREESTTRPMWRPSVASPTP